MLNIKCWIQKNAEYKKCWMAQALVQIAFLINSIKLLAVELERDREREHFSIVELLSKVLKHNSKNVCK